MTDMRNGRKERIDEHVGQENPGTSNPGPQGQDREPRDVAEEREEKHDRKEGTETTDILDRVNDSSLDDARRFGFCRKTPHTGFGLLPLVRFSGRELILLPLPH